MDYDVFISYSSTDKSVAQKVYAYLQQKGLKPWIAPQCILAGEPYARAIINGISKCRLMVVILSKTSNSSDDVLNEIDQAHGAKKVILPFIIDDTEMSGEMRYYLSRKQWIKAYPEVTTAQYEQLFRAIRAYLPIREEAQQEMVESQEEQQKIKSDETLSRRYTVIAETPQTKPQELKPAELKPEAKPKSANGKSEGGKVFVIYPMVDKDKILPLVKNLEKDVGTKFCMGIDDDNPYIEDEIMQAIDDATVVLYMHTANATRSSYTRMVLHYAAKTKKGMLIPVLLDDLKRSAMQFTATSCIDIRETGQIQKLTNDLRGYLNLSNSADRSTAKDYSATEKKEKSTSAPNTIARHQFVDLGLSVKWATCNVGANSPEEYGDYYAWGETNLKSSYTAGNCETWRKDVGDIKGTYRDVAHVKWGGSWRMPTKAEFEEIVNNCVWIWTTRNGVKGYEVTGVKTGNSIFLPAGGYRNGKYLFGEKFGCYWSSDKRSVEDANQLFFYDHQRCGKLMKEQRSMGCLVRPVTE